MTHQIMKDCPFREFINIFEKRILEAKAWKENGGKVIGYLGNEVPEELIIAAGFLPLRICGDPNLIDEAKTYLEEGFDSLIRAQFSAIISGKYDVIDYLVIANSSDPLVRVYYYLRALKK